MKKLLLMALVATIAFSGQTQLGAQEEKSEAAKQYRKAIEDFGKLMEGWSEKVTDARAKMSKASPAERAEINKTMIAAQQNLFAETTKIANQMKELTGSDDKEVAFDAISWILNTPYVRDEDVKKAASSKIVDHVNNKKVAKLLQGFGRGGLPSQATEDLFRLVAEKSTLPEVQGLATISLANYLRQNKTMVESMVKNPAFAKAYPDSIDYFKKLAATKDEDVEALLKTAADKFGEVEYQGSTIGEIASKQLKIIEVQKNLQIGKVAPDIQGPDIDGVEFKLSDYRGKVVLLDFWGDW